MLAVYARCLIRQFLTSRFTPRVTRPFNWQRWLSDLCLKSFDFVIVPRTQSFLHAQQAMRWREYFISIRLKRIRERRERSIFKDFFQRLILLRHFLRRKVLVNFLKLPAQAPTFIWNEINVYHMFVRCFWYYWQLCRDVLAMSLWSIREPSCLPNSV